ncbi:MAG: hypothetical protein N3I35_07650 [Clostridia bacterium]|nr:hypothetical protein [Clostridia bacterium]
MPILFLIIFGVFVFFVALYLIVKAAINNSEQLKEIKIMLMKAQNEENK